MTVAADQRYCLQIQVVAEVVTEITAEIAAEVLTKVATEILVVQLDQGVRNLVYCYVVVQAGSGFNVDTNTALYSTVAGR